MTYNVQWGRDDDGNPGIVSVTATPDQLQTAIRDYIEQISIRHVDYQPVLYIPDGLLGRNKLEWCKTCSIPSVGEMIEGIIATTKSTNVTKFSKFLEGEK